MNQSDMQLSSHFGTPFLYHNGLKRTAHKSPVQITESYFNHTRENLTIVKRNGLIVPLPSNHQFGFDEKLGIRIEFRVTNAALTEIKKQLNLLDDQDDEALKVLRNAVENTKYNPQVGHVQITLEYPLTLAELKKYGGTVYYAELDVVISTSPASTVVAHPYSERGRRENVATAVLADKHEEAFGYSVFIVDNHRQYGPRFLNISGKVYRVSPMCDPTQKDGVYVTSSKPTDGDLFTPGSEVLYYSFEAAEEGVGLYRTYDEALNLGDLSSAKREDLARIEQENLVLQKHVTLMKSQGSEIQAKHEREMHELQAFHARERLAMERERAEFEEAQRKQEAETERRRIEMKDHYETRSLQRKDTSEIVKVLPAIVVGVGVVATALFKIFGK